MPEAANRYVVDDRDDGRRIDNFLLRTLKGVPRTHIYKLLRSGQIRVNGSRTRPERRLTPGDEIRVPPAVAGDGSGGLPATAPISDRVLEQISRAVIAETDDVLVLNKPAGIAVHGGSGLAWGLIDVLRDLYPPPAMVELVHRLDRETSGLLLIARNNGALTSLSQQFRTHTVRKCYQALVQGRWHGGRQCIESRLEIRDDNAPRKVSSAADTTGKVARAWFSPRQRFEDATLMDVELLTGRTHQIRVQAESLGHALAGDARYGNSDFNRVMRERGLRRLFLHAGRLEFTLKGRAHAYDAPLATELCEVLAQMPAVGSRR